MWSLAQYTYQSTGSGGLGVLWLFYALFIVLYIVGYWKIFTKAGEPGWKSIIPVYNIVTALNIVGMSGWFALLFFVPFVNAVMAVILAYKLAKAFGYGIGMTILELIFGIGLLIIAFGDSKYRKPEGGPTIADTPYPKNTSA